MGAIHVGVQIPYDGWMSKCINNINFRREDIAYVFLSKPTLLGLFLSIQVERVESKLHT